MHKFTAVVVRVIYIWKPDCLESYSIEKVTFDETHAVYAHVKLNIYVHTKYAIKSPMSNYCKLDVGYN